RDEKGFDAFKWRVGAECGRDVDEWPGRTEAIVPQVARALGDDVARLVDANSGFSARRALEVGRLLEAEGISHYEEPCPYWKLAETKLVTDALDLDVAGGEQDWDLATWERMIDMHAVDIVQPDVMYMGGISRTLKVVNMAAAGCCVSVQQTWRVGHLSILHTGCGFRATITHARPSESADPDGRPADRRRPPGLRRQSSQDAASG